MRIARWIRGTFPANRLKIDPCGSRHQPRHQETRKIRASAIGGPTSLGAGSFARHLLIILVFPCTCSRIQSVMNGLLSWQPRQLRIAPVETLAPVVDTWELQPNTYWENREARQRRKSLAIAVLLFLLTVISTLAVGAQFASAYASGQSPDFNDFFSTYRTLLAHPQLLLAGVPFAFTLIGILLAHELGHYFRVPLLRYFRQLSLFHSRADADRNPRRIHPHPFTHPQSQGAI